MKISFISYFILFLMPLQWMSCQNNETKMNDKFEWTEAMSNPLGYPTEVFRGGLVSADGTYTSLYLGVTEGEWGEEGGGMRSGMKQLPNKLEAIWVAYAEDVTYKIEVEINHNKIVKLFKEGYWLPSMNEENPEPRKENYDEINVGFAPGGMVVIWVYGPGRQVEIGRYKGIKTEVSEEEVAKLDGPDKLLFSKEWREKIMKNEAIVPLEIQNKSKPIPYDLWETYREKYNWELEVILPESLSVKEVWNFYYNGEWNHLFGETLIDQYKDIPNEYKWDNRTEQAVPKKLGFLIDDKNGTEAIACDIAFNEEEIFNAFHEVLKDHPKEKIKLTIYFNEGMNYASIKLTSGNKETTILESDINIY